MVVCTSPHMNASVFLSVLSLARVVVVVVAVVVVVVLLWQVQLEPLQLSKQLL